MEMRLLVSQLMEKNIAEYLDGSSHGGFPVPRVFPPASAEQIEGLEGLAGQSLESGYREFLDLTDGMDGFRLDMPIFGCRDWISRDRVNAAIALRGELREDGVPVDVGLPANVELFPISVDPEGASAIFMLNSSEVFVERIWWIGGGSSSFFRGFADLLAFAIDPQSCSPREVIE